MKNAIVFISLFLFSHMAFSQVDYGTPKDQPLPEKLVKFRKAISVHHFPEAVDPIAKNDVYYWMHNTSVISLESDITITEFGAYIFYNDQWNLRQSYPLSDLDKFFKTKKQKLQQAKPYTWAENYRSGDTIFSGWALWYFIGITPEGESVCGYRKIFTSANLIKS